MVGETQDTHFCSQSDKSERKKGMTGSSRSKTQKADSIRSEVLSIILLGFTPCLLDPLQLKPHLPGSLNVETELVFLIISEHLWGHSFLFLKNSMCFQTDNSMVLLCKIQESDTLHLYSKHFLQLKLTECSYNHIISFSSDSPATSLYSSRTFSVIL